MLEARMTLKYGLKDRMVHHREYALDKQIPTIRVAIYELLLFSFL